MDRGKHKSGSSLNSAANLAPRDSPEEQHHKLKLSIDLLSVKDMLAASNVICAYQLKLSSGLQVFRSEVATPAGQSVEVKLQKGFCSFEFAASKTQLFSILSSNNLSVKVFHKQDHQEVPIGAVAVDLKEILSAPLKQSASAMLRVSDQYLPIKAGDDTRGLLRVISYLEDMGPAKAEDTNPIPEGNANPSSTDYQAVWQLEMWKRSEMAKFLVHLKQKEIERIEEVTSEWRHKEADREQTFQESLAKCTSVEGKLRTKAADLQRREERIIQLEEELKHKI